MFPPNQEDMGNNNLAHSSTLQNLVIFPEMAAAFFIEHESGRISVYRWLSSPSSLHLGALGVRPASFQPFLFGLGISGIAAVLLILPPTQCIWRASHTPPQPYQTAQACSVHIHTQNGIQPRMPVE